MSRESILSAISGNLFFRFFVNSRGRLNPLGENNLTSLLQWFSITMTRSNTVMIREGDSQNASLYLLIRGKVSVMTSSYELNTCHKGDWFGGESLIEESRDYSAIAQQDCLGFVLTNHALRKMQVEAPRLAYSMKRLLKGQSIGALLAILDGIVEEPDIEAVCFFLLLYE